MKKPATYVLLLLAIVSAAYLSFLPAPQARDGSPGTGAPEATARDARAGETVETAYAKQLRDRQLLAAGVVIRVLPDDERGSRHQRFIMRLASGHSLLVAHNIDLAPRVASLRAGDAVEVFGEYVWNAKGGVMHWTHHDPDGRHVDGWILRAGQRYQ